MAGFLSGLIGAPAQDPLGGLLRTNYNAGDQRWEGISQALGAASEAFLNPRQGGGGGWARAIGDIGGAMGKAGTAYGAGKTQYLATQLAKEQAQRKIEDENYARQKEQAQDQAWVDMVEGLSPEDRKMIQGNPELAKAYGEQWAQARFATSKDTTPVSIQEYEYAKEGGYKGTFTEYQAQKKAKAETTPASIKEYEYAKEGGYKGTFEQFKQEMKGNGIIIENKDGTRTIIGGSGKGGGETESTRRAKLLSAQMAPSVENLKTTYNSLTDPMNYAGNFARAIGGRYVMTPEGQQAADSISSVVAAFGYLRSGQALTAQEIRQGTEELTPYPSDAPATKDLKWSRLEIMYQAAQSMAANQGAGGQPAPTTGDPNAPVPEPPFPSNDPFGIRKK